MAKEKTKTLNSLYAGTIARSDTNLPVCHTVGELIAVLCRLPPSLPLHDEGIKPVWFNIGHDEPWSPEFIALEPDDGMWDDEWEK